MMSHDVLCDRTSSYSGKYAALWLRRPGFDSQTGQSYCFGNLHFYSFTCIFCVNFCCVHTDILKNANMEFTIMHKCLQTEGGYT